MDPERWRRIEALYGELVELPEPERAARLREVAGGDPGLSREVEALLAADAPGAAMIERVVGAAAGELALDPVDGLIGRTLGPYRLVERVGHGGMGAVYRAEREDEFAKEVAVKLVQGHLATPEMVRRFRSERQILAQLEHPGIARLLDGGTTGEGVPYLVMEFVRGEPIDAHCRARGLGLRARIELFLRVCDAVEYAHRMLVVHRDLKPSNVLVDDAGAPRLLDFGVASLLTAEPDADAPTASGLTVRLLTPRYASPEQLRGERVTPASDVYALGLLLYELLTGSSPYPVEDGTAGAIERAVREKEPTPPSAAVRRAATTAGDGPDRAGERRRLAERLAGDLDAILLKALRKEPAARFGSVAEFAADLRNHLESRPVSARQGGRRYRVGRFLRRRRVPVALGAVIAMLLIGATIATSLQSARIARERDRADLEAAAAREVTDFLVRMFESSDPGRGGGPDQPVGTVLSRGAARVTQELADRPELQARLLGTIGTVWTGLGAYDSAVVHLERALAVERRAGSGDSLALAERYEALGTAERRRGALDRAFANHSAALGIRARRFGSEHPTTALSWNSLGVVYYERGEYDSARVCYERAEAAFAGAPEHQERRADALNNLGTLLDRIGRQPEAVEVHRRALAIRERVHGAESLPVAQTLYNLSIPLGRTDSGLVALRRSIEISERLLPADHPDLGGRYNVLAANHLARKEWDEARAASRRSVAIREKAFGPDHPSVANSLNMLANIARESGRIGEADSLYRRTLAILETRLGRDHPTVVYPLGGLVTTHLAQGRAREALAFADRRLSLAERAYGATHREVTLALRDRASALASLGRAAEAAAAGARADSIAAVAGGG